MCRRFFAEQRVGIGDLFRSNLALIDPGFKGWHPGSRAQKPDEARCQNDDGKGNGKAENGDKSPGCYGQHRAVPERPAADADDGLNDYGEDRSLEPEKQTLDNPDIAPDGINPAQPHDGDDARYHEQHTGNDAACRAMHQPADIDSELLGLRPRQQHAVVEGVQKSLLAKPFVLFDKNAMHHGDLAGRPAEAQEADPSPYSRGLGECGVGTVLHARPKQISWCHAV